MKLRLFLLLTAAAVLTACATVQSPEHAAITAAAKRYLKDNAAATVGETRITVEEVADRHARVGVTPVKPTTDPAIMYLRQNAAGAWEGLSIGTGFSPDDYDDLGIPQAVRR